MIGAKTETMKLLQRKLEHARKRTRGVVLTQREAEKILEELAHLRLRERSREPALVMRASLITVEMHQAKGAYSNPDYPLDLGREEVVEWLWTCGWSGHVVDPPPSHAPVEFSWSGSRFAGEKAHALLEPILKGATSDPPDHLDVKVTIEAWRD